MLTEKSRFLGARHPPLEINTYLRQRRLQKSFRVRQTKMDISKKYKGWGDPLGRQGVRIPKEGWGSPPPPKSAPRIR